MKRCLPPCSQKRALYLLHSALLCLMLAGCGTLRQQAVVLPQPLSSSLISAGIPESSVALDIRTVEGERLYVHHAGQSFKPASVMKLVTTAAALELLGPDYRWLTRVHAVGALKGDVLQGDLFIEGGGDPRFAHEDLSRLLRRLRSLGLREIRGDLVLDRSLFQLAPADPAAFDASPERSYNALPNALLLDASAVSVRLVPDLQSGRALVSAEPPMHNFHIDTPLLNDQPCSQWRDQLKPLLVDRSLRFEGSFPTSCGERLLSLHAYSLSAAQYFDTVFRQLWIELGGEMTGQTREGIVPVGARELLTWESRTLAEIIRDINKYSNNVMARQLLLSLVIKREDRPATTAAGAARVLDWLARSGVDTKLLVIENGSGLSRSERISAETMSVILQKEWGSPLMPEFIASLPVAGIDGTMSQRVQVSGVRGQAHIKTGSLADVASIAGYLRAKSGRRIILTCMINHANAAAARPALDELIQWIYERY